MAQQPEAVKQILRARLRRPCCRADLPRPSPAAQPMAMLQVAEAQGWHRLDGVIRAIVDGRRDRSVLLGLDDEDRVIAEAILAGLEDPANLTPLVPAVDPTTAAPGLAAMIHAAARRDVQTITALAYMAEQMLRVGGDMARLGGIQRRLIDGERDADLLSRGMGPLGRSRVLDLLNELARLRTH